MRWTAQSTVAALMLALAREASAQVPEPAPAPVTLLLGLRYTLGAGADRCPAEEMLHQEVGRRVGYDPFVRGASDAGAIDVGRVTASIARAPKGLAATYEYENPDGSVEWTKTYFVPGTSSQACEVAISGMAVELAFELVLRKRKLAPPPPPPPRSPACSASKPLPAAEPLPCWESPYAVWPREPPMLGPAPEPPKPPERWPIAVRFGAAVWPEVIANGFGSLGLTAEIGARYKAISAGVELHGDPPLGSQLFEKRASFARMSGALLVCAHYGWFVGCGPSAPSLGLLQRCRRARGPGVPGRAPVALPRHGLGPARADPPGELWD